ncbi:MAG: hypothetical protein ACEPOW_11255 [Bacteroidales bacterium]
MRKIVLFIAAFLLISTSASFAQQGRGFARNKKEIVEYIKTNVFPVVQKERASFDEKLNSTEKAQIAKIREEMAKKRQEIVAARGEFRSSNADTVACRQKLCTLRAERTDLLKGLNSILKSHKEDLNAIKDRIASQKKQWNADIRSKIQARGNRNPNPRMEFVKKVMRAKMFLLIDANKSFDENSSNLKYLYPNFNKKHRGKRNHSNSQRECGQRGRF